MTKQEFFSYWQPRLCGLFAYALVDKRHRYLERSTVDNLVESMLETMCLQLAEDTQPPADYLEVFATIGSLIELQDKMDETNYLPATVFLDPVHYPDFKAIHRTLQKNPSIRRRSPRKNRLRINAADWLRTQAKKTTTDSLDSPADIVDAVLETDRRKAELLARRKHG